MLPTPFALANAMLRCLDLIHEAKKGGNAFFHYNEWYSYMVQENNRRVTTDLIPNILY